MDKGRKRKDSLPFAQHETLPMTQAVLQTPKKQDLLTLAQQDPPTRKDKDLMIQTQILARSDAPGLSSPLTTQLPPSTAPSMDLAAWKPPPGDTHQLLTLNVDRLHLSSRATIYISTIMQERFTIPYHRCSEVPSDVRDMLWGEFQKRYVWDLTLSMTKMRHAWEVKVGDRMRDFAWRCSGSEEEARLDS
ncbi:hypothetical protein M9H77_12599 [Catharanthus roseus]|uniref:Uncharacterized protein n=1 Tax=Catharanthus roseus TaxID=4058 RepID=A0ACC0BHV8_CATRO|nr:hypothetical protein M9H77_12599 [Catharanthus roseus]